MQTQKEILRDIILSQMQPYMDTVMLDILRQVIVKALFNVDVVQMETLPATSENTNEHIFKMFSLKKEPKLSPETAKYYKSSVRHLIEFTGKSLLDISDMDIELYLDEYRRGRDGKPNKSITVNNERRNISAFLHGCEKRDL